MKESANRHPVTQRHYLFPVGNHTDAARTFLGARGGLEPRLFRDGYIRAYIGTVSMERLVAGLYGYRARTTVLNRDTVLWCP